MMFISELEQFVREHRTAEDQAAFSRLTTALAATTDDFSEYGYWYPLARLKDTSQVVAFNLEDLYWDKKIDLLKSVLTAAGIKNCCFFQFQTTSQGLRQTQVDLIALLYEEDEDDYIFPWMVETYFYGENQDWLIYVSHECTITFGGNRLVSIAKEIIPQSYQY